MHVSMYTYSQSSFQAEIVDQIANTIVWLQLVQNFPQLATAHSCSQNTCTYVANSSRDMTGKEDRYT